MYTNTYEYTTQAQKVDQYQPINENLQSDCETVQFKQEQVLDNTQQQMYLQNYNNYYGNNYYTQEAYNKQANYFPYYNTNQYYYNQANTFNHLPTTNYNTQFNYSEPSTLQPTAPLTAQPIGFSERTPEKSNNDSGIELISPQFQPIAPQQKLEQSENLNNYSDNIQQSDSDEESECEENESPVKATSKKVKASDSAAKPPKPYLEIIADSILSTNVKMMQLHEIYHLMEKKFQYFAKNINKSWRNSVRHNLSLNECFVKAGRGSNGKGNYWKIHPLCEKEFIRGNFRRKSFKQLIRAGSNNRSAAQQVPFQDYSLNYQNMPPTLPAQLVQSFAQNSTAPSFGFNQFNFNQYQSSDIQSVYPTESKKPAQRYQPY